MNNIHIGYFLGGLVFLSNAVYGVVTGDIIGASLEIENKDSDQFPFYFTLIICSLLGGCLFFRSFLNIGNNREFHENASEESYYEDTSVDLVNIIKLLLIMLAVLALIIFLKF